MGVSFSESETKKNLLRAFAGESQARNRYVFSARKAKKENLYVVEAVFEFTAKQEEAHAKVFYDLLKEFAGENIAIDGAYPIDQYDSVVKLLRAGQHNEYEEHDDVYKSFGEKAQEEGFGRVASAFQMIAGVEKTHGDRFGMLADLIEQDKLFVSEFETKWMCLNCGYIYEGKQVPEKCPVCQHNKGFFIRLELAPYAK